MRGEADFLADLIAENDPSFKIRDDVKPLNITQPEGVSFKMNGSSIEWQKWNGRSATQRQLAIAR